MKKEYFLELFSLLLLTVTETGVFLTNGLANPFKRPQNETNTTEEDYRPYTTEITPASYAFSIWGVIYAWDIMWIFYAWSFICRPYAQRTIFTPVYWFRALINVFNMSWIFLWGNDFIIGACIALYGFAVSYWISNGLLVVYFKKIRDKVNTYDKVLTWLIPINGMFLYATWVTLAAQLNFTIVLTYLTSAGDKNSGTVGLSLVIVALFVYTILEFTVGVLYLQYVYTVYPVLLWACVAILVVHWDQSYPRNNIFTILLLVSALVLFTAKIILSLIYGRFLCVQKSSARQEEGINLQYE